MKVSIDAEILPGTGSMFFHRARASSALMTLVTAW